jgi:hypothetical protein
MKFLRFVSNPWRKSRDGSREMRLRLRLAQAERLKELATVYDDPEIAEKAFPVIPNIKQLSIDDLRTMSALNTPFEPVAKKLGLRNDPTLGRIIEKCGLTKYDLELLMFHWADARGEIVGSDMAGHLRYFARLSFKDWFKVLLSRVAERGFGQAAEQTNRTQK